MASGNGASLTLGDASRQLDTLDSAALDKQRRLITLLLNERAWTVLKRLGYKYYREVSMNVEFATKDDVSLVTMTATYENYHKESDVTVSVPLKLFEGILKPETLAAKSDE